MLEKIQRDRETLRARVVQQYDPDTAAKILRQEIWQGMTVQQLLDSAGQPDSVQETVTKRINREVWKYDVWSTRVTVENGVVVGWRNTK